MVLEYNKETERYNNLSCGESLKIKINEKWVDVRIELNGEGYYFIDENGFTKKCNQLEGCEIKIN